MCNVKRIVQHSHTHAQRERGAYKCSCINLHPHSRRVRLPCLLHAERVEEGGGRGTATDQAKVMSVNQGAAADAIVYIYSYASL